MPKNYASAHEKGMEILPQLQTCRNVTEVPKKLKKISGMLFKIWIKQFMKKKTEI